MPIWGGTFHAVATRLLRIHAKAIGLEPGFTIHDRSDSEDLLDVVRTELGLATTVKRFRKKGKCMAIFQCRSAVLGGSSDGKAGSPERPGRGAQEGPGHVGLSWDVAQGGRSWGTSACRTDARTRSRRRPF